jgi:hypothetical protein
MGEAHPVALPTKKQIMMSMQKTPMTTSETIDMALLTMLRVHGGAGTEQAAAGQG